MKMYKRGFYGGKFLPFHKGHKYCIEIAASECDDLVVIFFSNSEEEQDILSKGTVLDKNLLEYDKRVKDIENECGKYLNVRFEILDCSKMHKEAIENGTDLWDSETKYVINTVGDFQAVYSSEPNYNDYFKRAYPFAVHRLIDPPREHIPISGTLLRSTETPQAIRWLKDSNDIES